MAAATLAVAGSTPLPELLSSGCAGALAGSRTKRPAGISHLEEGMEEGVSVSLPTTSAAADAAGVAETAASCITAAAASRAAAPDLRISAARSSIPLQSVLESSMWWGM